MSLYVKSHTTTFHQFFWISRDYRLSTTSYMYLNILDWKCTLFHVFSCIPRQSPAGNCRVGTPHYLIAIPGSRSSNLFGVKSRRACVIRLFTCEWLWNAWQNDSEKVNRRGRWRIEYIKWKPKWHVLEWNFLEWEGKGVAVAARQSIISLNTIQPLAVFLVCQSVCPSPENCVAALTMTARMEASSGLSWKMRFTHIRLKIHTSEPDRPRGEVARGFRGSRDCGWNRELHSLSHPRCLIHSVAGGVLNFKNWWWKRGEGRGGA